MSWGIEVKGTKAGVVKRVTELLDRSAASYDGNQEAKDVLAAKDRILALVDALDLSSDGYTDWNVVEVKASGSHSTSGKGITSANMQISVSRSSMALDPES